MVVKGGGGGGVKTSARKKAEKSPCLVTCKERLEKTCLA